MVDPLSDRSEALGLILSIEKEGKGKKETRTIWSTDKPLLNPPDGSASGLLCSGAAGEVSKCFAGMNPRPQDPGLSIWKLSSKEK